MTLPLVGRGSMWTDWTSWTLCSGCGNQIIQYRNKSCIQGYNCDVQMKTDKKTCEAVSTSLQPNLHFDDRLLP